MHRGVPGRARCSARRRSAAPGRGCGRRAGFRRRADRAVVRDRGVHARAMGRAGAAGAPRRLDAHRSRGLTGMVTASPSHGPAALVRPLRSPGGLMAGTVLSPRAAGRATLARQHLLQRTEAAAAAEIAHLGGMQAQAPLAPYVGLWTRLGGFTTDELSALYRQRQVVRIALMRGTIHLVTAEDALAWRTLVDPVIERGTQGAFGRHYRDLDRAQLAEAARELTEQEPRTFAELGTLLAERFPDRDPAALAQAARAQLPLVQVPPRGVWGERGRIAHTTTRAWLGRDPLD